MGIYLSRQTMGNWLLYGAEQWLVMLYKRMHEHLLARTILHADETTFKSYVNLVVPQLPGPICGYIVQDERIRLSFSMIISQQGQANIQNVF